VKADSALRNVERAHTATTGAASADTDAHAEASAAIPVRAADAGH